MCPVEQCPRCGSFIEGSPVYSIIRQGTKAGAKYAVKKVIIYIATPLILTILGPLGTITGFIVAFFIVLYIDKKATEITDSFDLGVNSSTPFDFQCPHCRKTWNRTYTRGIDYTTDAVLKWEKTVLAEKIKNDASSNLFWAFFAGIIALPCAYFCLSNLNNQSSYLIWWLVFIIGMPALIISISNGIMSHNRKKEAEYLEYMTASEFRNSAYRAGNPFVGTVKKLDEENEVKPIQQKVISQPLQPKIIVPVTEEPTKQISHESSDSIKEDLAKLDDLLAAGILAEKEHAEQIKKIAPTTHQATEQSHFEKRYTETQVENNKIAILKNLRLLLDSGILSNKEFKSQKSTTLSVVSIPWDKNKSKYEILEEMKSLLDSNVLTQEEFDFHKTTVLSNNSSDNFSKSLPDNLAKLDDLLAAGVVTNDEYIEEKKIISSYVYHSAKEENNKIAILKGLKMLLDSGIFTLEEYKKQKLSTLSVASIPWDKNKSKYEILEEMKSLLDADILSQEEFDFHKKALLSENN